MAMSLTVIRMDEAGGYGVMVGRMRLERHCQVVSYKNDHPRRLAGCLAA